MSWQMDRESFAKEIKLRSLIREAIQVVKERRAEAEQNSKLQEQELRSHIRTIIEAEVADETPHESTGINILEKLLKKIVPIIKSGYFQLTTSQEQRKSFRAHIIRGTQNLLAPTRALGASPGAGLEEQEINMDVGDDKEDKFIDVEPPEEVSPEDEKKKDFSIGGMDSTGRNVALDVFKAIETNIVDAYDLIDNEQDKEVFYDYLLTNLKLHMDGFEDKLADQLPEPTTPEYEKEKEKLGEGEPEDKLFELDYEKLEKIAEQ